VAVGAALDRQEVGMVGRYVCVTGVHGVMESQRDPELLAIHNASGLTTPDGMPLVWAGRRAGMAHMRRVYGPDLMLAVCRLAAEQGWSCYFYGAGEGVPELLAQRLANRFPGLKVAGTMSPSFRPLTQGRTPRWSSGSTRPHRTSSGSG
jgi:N-acetylglucosaminyldiphosphoundecaprenol N-acetyl-beta-D-mannosaminyltransferase